MWPLLPWFGGLLEWSNDWAALVFPWIILAFVRTLCRLRHRYSTLAEFYESEKLLISMVFLMSAVLGRSAVAGAVRHMNAHALTTSETAIYLLQVVGPALYSMASLLLVAAAICSLRVIRDWSFWKPQLWIVGAGTGIIAYLFAFQSPI